jgi:carbon monoxide dehydrogenase subunit G
MDMSGEYRIAAPREAVWAALNDPDLLRQCIPGCEEIEKTSPTEFTAKVTAKVGPVKARFGGKVAMTDLDPPNGYRISGEGQGGAAGFAKGGAEVKLEADGDGTILRYTVNANVGGKLAQIGSRLIDATARKMAEEFFGRFAELVAANAAAATPAPDAIATPDMPAAAPAPTPAAAPKAAPPPPPAPAPAARKTLSPSVWIIGLIALAVLILLVFATPR